MNDEILEGKKNNTNKILIAIIIILLLVLGGLSYYTFFVRNKKGDKPNPVVEPTKPIEDSTIDNETEKNGNENDNYEFSDSENLSYKLSVDLKYKNKEEVNKSISTFPYEDIDIYNSYSETVASTMLTTSWKNVESKYKIFHTIEAPFGNEILFEHLNLTDEEIKEANKSIVWKDASLNSGGYELIDIKEIDKKIRELYGDNVNLFEHSFADGSIVYDKNLNILLKSLHGTTAITYERKTMIIETKSINNKYEITFINAMFEQYPGESNAKLYNVSSDNIDIPYSIAELSNNEKLVNEILKENQDNLDTYKVTFELENNLYMFKNIEKIS